MKSHSTLRRTFTALMMVSPLVASCDCGGHEQPVSDGGDMHMELPVIPGEPSGILFDIGVEKNVGGDVTLIYATTASGGKARLFYTPVPSHTEPHTGSPALENKANFQAYPLLEDSDLEDTMGGPCDPADSCRIPAADLLLHRVPLVTPARIRVESVRFESWSEAQLVSGTRNHWSVRMRVGDVHILAGHIGWIGPDLRQRLIDAGGPDTDTFVTTESTQPTELMPEGADIVMEAHEVFAYPQLNNLAFQQVGRHSLPFSQIEYFYAKYTPAPEFAPLDESPYRYLSESVRTDLRSWMRINMAAKAFNYGSYPGFDWLYLAEADLEPQSSADYMDTSTIFGRFGEWYENADVVRGSCSAPAPYCNEGFFFWRVRRDTDVFDSSLYENPNVHMLMVHSEKGAGTRNSFLQGEVVTPDDPDPRAGTLVTRWRLQAGEALPAMTYQAYRYALVGEVLTVVKGMEQPSRAAAEAEALTLQDPTVATCEGEHVVCLYRHFFGGLPGGN